MDYVLGVDLGTTAIKVTLYDSAGKLTEKTTVEYGLLTPSSLIVEQEVGVYWDAFRNGLRTVLGSSQVTQNEIKCMGISAQGETLIALDKNSEALRPAIVWMDNRASEEAEILANRFTNEEIHETTGQVSMLPMWPAAKVLWLQRHEPEVFRKTRKFLLIEDYFIHRLTGEFVSEGSLLCSTTYWDINTKKYWPEMLETLGIDEARLPDIREPGVTIGTVRPKVGEELHLSSDLSVTTGALDQACGAIGAGNIKPGIFSESTGSNVAVCSLVDKPTLDPSRQLPCFYYGIPNTYMMHAFSMTGGMVLRWFRDNFCTEEMRAASRHGIDSYDILTEAASAIPAGSSGLVLLPHFQGAGLPESNPEARGVLYGLSLHHTKAHVVRAIMESIAMVLHRMIDAVTSMGITVSEIRSHGGGANSDLWCQIKADINNLPVLKMKNTQDAACLGAAMLAGVANGIWPSVEQAVNQIVEFDKRFEPSPENRKLYARQYEIYRELYDDLIELFHK